MTRARAFRAVVLTAGLAVTIVLIARLGPARILGALDRVGTRAGWLVIAYAAGTAIGALPFYVVFAPEARPSLCATMTGRFAASGINVILPVFGLGGEPTRLLWLAPEHRAAGVAAIVIDRLTYAAASSVFLFGGVLAALDLATLPASYTIGGLVGAGVLFAIAIAAIRLLSRRGIGDRLHRLAIRLARRDPDRRSPFGAAIDRELAAMIARRRALALAALLGLAARFALGVEVWIAFHLLGIALSPSAAYVFAAVPVVLTLVGALVPGQLGLQEGSQALIAGALGVDPSTAVAAVLLTRVRQLLTAALGWVLVAHATRRRARRVRAEGTSRSGFEAVAKCRERR